MGGTESNEREYGYSSSWKAGWESHLIVSRNGGGIGKRLVTESVQVPFLGQKILLVNIRAFLES